MNRRVEPTSAAGLGGAMGSGGGGAMGSGGGRAVSGLGAELLTCLAVVLDAGPGAGGLLPALQVQLLVVQLDLGQVLLDVDGRLFAVAAGRELLGPVVLVQGSWGSRQAQSAFSGSVGHNPLVVLQVLLGWVPHARLS